MNDEIKASLDRFTIRELISYCMEISHAETLLRIMGDITQDKADTIAKTWKNDPRVNSLSVQTKILRSAENKIRKELLGE